jgi:hypothetical protein
MSSVMPEQLGRFVYSVIRVVPDPIKDEAINVGVVVTPAEGAGGAMRVHLNDPVRARIKAAQNDYDIEALRRSLEDLRAALGIDPRLVSGEAGTPPAGAAVLDGVAGRLGNQLQLTPPRRYLALSLDEAVQKLFARYVTWRLPTRKRGKRLTHAALRDQILQVVSAWESPTLRVEQGGMLRGQSATHHADIVVHNGHPRAALFAVPTYRSDEELPYLYRDRIPTVAQDMPADFSIYAVLPPLGQSADEAERRFAEETRRLLGAAPGVSTVALDELAAVRPKVERLLVDASLTST